MSNYPEKVLLNDAILNASEAKVSVFDRGFLFGDGVYEVMVRLDNRFFFGKEHLDRLASSLKKVRLSFELSTLPQKIDRLLAATGLTTEDCLLYIQITRGTAPRKHAFPKDIAPTLLMYAVPFVLPEVNDRPVSAVTRPDFRWHRCDIKMTSLLGNVMANDFAIQNGHYEAIFNRDGKMTEGTHSNLFFVNEGMVFTHPADEHILNGITREIVLQLCRDNDIPYREEAIAFERINAMDEAFLTGTTTQIAAIGQIDDHTFYHRAEPGPVTKKLQQLFFELKKNPPFFISNNAEANRT